MSQDETTNNLTSINGFKNLKAKVVESKKVIEKKSEATTPLATNSKSINQIKYNRSKNTSTKPTAISSAKTTPRAQSRSSISLKESNFFNLTSAKYEMKIE